MTARPDTAIFVSGLRLPFWVVTTLVIIYMYCIYILYLLKQYLNSIKLFMKPGINPIRQFTSSSVS